jgi:tetratricopeptide (TPR) repeat protein
VLLGDLERRLLGDADNIETANAYRRAVIRSGAYDRAIRFFGSLVAAHPGAANAHLNYGFSYVDKIPAAGSITQVILANSALTQFTRSIDLRPSWIAYYTRGASYLFWPKIFGRMRLGIADLEEALRIQRGERKRSYHARTFVALGDGYWKADDVGRARAIWQEGLQQFPGHAPLEQRLSADAESLAAIIQHAFDPSRRVDTDLSELWSAR